MQPLLIARPPLPLRPWMPPTWRRAVAGREVELHIPEPVRRRCRKPARIAPSAWSVRRRRMPAADAYPGPYRIEFARFAAKVMDTWAQPWVREVCFCGVDQASKTNTMLSCIGWSLEHRPRNVFYQMPDEASSDKIMGKKVIPMLRESPCLAARLSPRADDTSLGGVTLADGTAIIPSWAGSPTSTATFSAGYTFSDEIDKMKMVGKEADPLDRIRKRTRTNRFAKHFFSGTPAGMFIYKMTMACVQVWAAAGRCPECNELILMDEDHVLIPEGATAESIKEHPESIEYSCNACGALWDEAARALAYEHGDWVCIKGAEVARPVDVGFLQSAFPMTDVPLASIAQTILRAKAGDQSARRDLAHGIKAIDHVEEIKERKEDAILLLRDQRPAGVVPMEADALAIVLDTQDKGFWYEIRAWRFGIDLKSWLVKYGYLPSATAEDFSGPDALLAAEYPDEHGTPQRIVAGMIDSGGHRTAEVYAWCRRSGVLPAKGASSRKSNPVTVSRLDRFPGNNRPIPGGLNLYHLDTHFHKDLLANKLQIDPTDPGAWVLHSGYTPDQLVALERDPATPQGHNLNAYAKQYCSEYRDERNLWQCPEGKANHLWDCGQMGLALAMFLGWQHAVGEKSAAKVAPNQDRNTNQQSSAGQLPSWFRR